jgi:subtilisin family serine protease
VQARVPGTALTRLASDDRLFAIYGPPLHPATDNANAAILSHVTPLFSAPYNLTGSGVVLSLFELGAADATHPQFGGRLNVRFTGGASEDVLHATHVSGTLIASGQAVPAAKGMAPAATLQEFSVQVDTAVWMNDKQTTLPSLGVVADNNSWGFQLGWQSVSSAPGSIAWFGSEEYFGGYDGFYSAPYDKVAKNGPTLLVHSAGNDGSSGFPSLSQPWSPHGHTDNNGDLVKGETFCYSQDGSGTDCPTPTCSPGQSTVTRESHCEKTKHPTYGPYTTIGVLAGTKNVVAVGAVYLSGDIAPFSSRGPTRDGRVKPDVVAKGVRQFSTKPSDSYGELSGTSMASPVVTGISALLVEQWRKTFSGQNPTPEMLKVLLIAGADDLGNPGPDYTYGFGLANAQASVDLILADNNTQSRIRTGTLSQGQQVETPLTVVTPGKVRVVLGWADPEVLLTPQELATKTLVNDLDVKLIDPSGNPVLPYVLDPANPSVPATRGVNSIDNVEEIEIAKAAAGTYRLIIKGTSIASGPTQSYVLIANAPLGAINTCTDSYAPNDTPATAFGNIPTGSTLSARFCTQSDVDYFKFTALTGPVTVTVTATDTPVRVTLLSNGTQMAAKTIAAGMTDSVGFTEFGVAGNELVRLEPAGTIGPNAGYTMTVNYPYNAGPRRRSTHR